MKNVFKPATLGAGLAATALTSTTAAFAQDAGTDVNVVPIYSEECITEQQVVAAQKAWGAGIVKIGEVYSAGGDYEAAASDHINTHYAYDLSLVLFKPTLAAVDQFRASFDGALSYFIGGNPSYPEDNGFAIKPWSKVRWQNAGIVNNNCNMAVAMGNYFFTPAAGGDETKVEYTIAYIKDAEGDLRILVHQSSLPYAPS
ncbi:MAG: phosphoribosyl-AMP cyclohydrolase [Erythrobacter sp.]|uniref:phosphoribosyl-AMP cyclohydrolase n=1 Tax=Erythrobacter sp. TaxID=1042 RepID=UPI002621943F|nr:phosphoribosyl-AMP cyclohydrolase [Erythrobacter sp.]MDJ0977266.1 phosphoribosyl-AMP cyclohydrolase [Erythrobacter sp.]